MHHATCMLFISIQFQFSELYTFEDRDVLWRLPYVQVVRVSELHLVVAVPAQQLVHGVLCKALQHKQMTGETRSWGLFTGITKKARSLDADSVILWLQI